MIYLYTVLYTLALAVLFPFEYLKRPQALRKRWLREKFGQVACERTEQKVILIHAVSVGEVIASVPLLRKIKEEHPNVELVVTTITDTGQGVAKEKIGDIARIFYLPFDFKFAVNTMLSRINPSLMIIIETELWPNIITLCRKKKIPVLLINGRISGRSFRGYKKLKFFFARILEQVSFFGMQNERYAERIKGMGAPPEKVWPIGSLKFDTRPSSPVPDWTKVFSGPVIIAGSTHRTEEDLVLDAYIELKIAYPQLNLILAPRHPGRFAEVEELIQKRGLSYLKRSAMGERIEARRPMSPEASPSSSRTSGFIVLLDVMGELSSVYGVCDIAVMGGSFVEHGGQNLLEPAYWEKAIICGPHMENFPFAEEFYKEGAAREVNRDTLTPTLHELLSSQEKREAMGKAAKKLYHQNAGAAQRALAVVEEYL